MRPAILVAVLLLLVAVPTVAVAEIIISGEQIILPYADSDQSCSMELFIKLTEGSTLPSLFSATTYATLLPPSAGVSIAGVGKTVNHPYVFTSSIGFNGVVEASKIDVVDLISVSEPPPANNAGLVKIDFLIAGGTVGRFDFVIDPSQTYFLDNGTGDKIFGTPISGSIDIVPEPGSLALLLSGTLAVGALVWRRKRLSRQ